jgi:hypothetical protein
MRVPSPIVLVSASMLAACGGGGASPASPTSGGPTPTSSDVGPAGGTVTAAGGAVRLVVPAGALATPVALSIRSASGLPLDPHAIVSTAFTVVPPGTTFTTPATLVLHYDPSLGPSGVPERDLRVHVLAGGEWEPEAGATTDVGTNEATAPISSSGTFAVRWTGPSGTCSSATDRQFDFWLGTWDYHQANLPLARNEITKEERGCLVEEHYQDPAGGFGRSVSLYSHEDGRWHQTYVDSGGLRLVLVGSLVGRRMVLFRTAVDRFVWDPVDAGTVRYYEEQSSDGGNTWNVSFDSRYTRQ